MFVVVAPRSASANECQYEMVIESLKYSSPNWDSIMLLNMVNSRNGLISQLLKVVERRCFVSF